MIELTHQEIDTNSLLAAVQSARAGAVVLFLGTTREVTGEKVTASLDYECHPPMALKQLERLCTEARNRWPLENCGVVHRLGHLEIGEASIAVAIASPHRADAFAAASWLMDEIKQRVPIWKRENWTDGTSEWVHPGLEVPREVASERREDAQ